MALFIIILSKTFSIAVTELWKSWNHSQILIALGKDMLLGYSIKGKVLSNFLFTYLTKGMKQIKIMKTIMFKTSTSLSTLFTSIGPI